MEEKRSRQIESLRRRRFSLLTPLEDRLERGKTPVAAPAPRHEQSGDPRAGTAREVHHYHYLQSRSPAKSMGLAYVLWLFAGALGVHRFYLGRTGSGVAMLLLALLGWLPLFMGWVVLGFWLFVDIFLIPGMTHDSNRLSEQPQLR